MGKKRDPYGVTPAYLAWKRKASPGVFDREKDRQVPVEEIHDDPVVTLNVAIKRPARSLLARQRRVRVQRAERSAIAVWHGWSGIGGVYASSTSTDPRGGHVIST